MPRFLPVLEDGREAKGHGETFKRYQVQVRVVSFGSRRNSLDGEQKTRRQRDGRQPDVDFVPGEEIVAMQ